MIRNLILVIALLSFGVAPAISQLMTTGAGGNGVSANVNTPTLIQWTGQSNSKTSAVVGGGSITSYDSYLPATTQGGNTIVGCVTGNNTSTFTITDDAATGGNTYSIADTITDGSAVGLRIFYSTTTKAARKVTLTPSSGSIRVAPVLFEYNNIAASPLDGHIDGAATSATITAGSSGTGVFTGSGTANDLIVQCGWRYGTEFVNATPPYTAGSQTGITWKLSSTDAIDGLAVQAGQYSLSSSLSPAFTTASSAAYLTAAIALKTASAGASRPSGMQIVGSQHESIIITTESGVSPLELQFPSSGNLLIASIVMGSSAAYAVTGITDSASNTWVAAGATVTCPTCGSNDRSQLFYAANATASSSLAIHVATNTLAADGTIVLYDITGAATAPYVGNTLNFNNDSHFEACCGPTRFTGIVPGSSDGMAFITGGQAFNTFSATTAPASSGIIDAGFCHGLSLSGPEPCDQNNVFGHYKYSSSATQTWTLTYTQDGANNQNNFTTKLAFFKSATGTSNPYVIQAPSNLPCHATTNSTACAVTSTGSGNTLILVATNSNSTPRTISSITNGCTGSWTQVTSALGTRTSNSNIDTWYCSNSAASTVSITVNFSAAITTSDVWIWEVAGVTQPDGNGNHVNNGSAVSNVISAGSITTVSTSGIMVAGASVSNVVDVNPASANECSQVAYLPMISSDGNGACLFVYTTAAAHQGKFHDPTASDAFDSTTAAFKP